MGAREQIQSRKHNGRIPACVKACAKQIGCVPTDVWHSARNGGTGAIIATATATYFVPYKILDAPSVSRRARGGLVLGEIFET